MRESWKDIAHISLLCYKSKHRSEFRKSSCATRSNVKLQNVAECKDPKISVSWSIFSWRYKVSTNSLLNFETKGGPIIPLKGEESVFLCIVL